LSFQLVHDMDLPWPSSNAALLTSLPSDGVAPALGPLATRLHTVAGALNAFVEFLPAAPLDLGAFDELRFWVNATRAARGSAAAPFYLEFSYVDAGDLPGELHRWFVPVNAPGRWELRRIGIENDRRTAINRLRFTCLTGVPFACRLDHLLAVREEMLPDLEVALASHLGANLGLPGTTAVALSQNGNPGDVQVVIPPTPGFAAGNRIRIEGGGSLAEEHSVSVVTPGVNTTLAFGGGETLLSPFPSGVATVTLLVPVIVESPPAPASPPTPAVLVTPLDAREDLDRTGYALQRDSFRARGALTVCSMRPAARACSADYQITILASERPQQRVIHDRLLDRISAARALWVLGTAFPVWILPPPALLDRATGQGAPMYVRIGTRRETAPRREGVFVVRAEVAAARKDAPLDQEGIVLNL
jgi:hypothetical protein